jgi:hypothetical protein
MVDDHPRRVRSVEYPRVGGVHVPGRDSGWSRAAAGRRT